MIKLIFYPQARLENEQALEFKTYKEFFDFFIENYQQGIITCVEDDSSTK